ncbi:hypothetical protein [Pseudomonas sp. Irchel s3h14]|uniref:hypothetical protein n=1 Tax=Pseudomonas sp. Irchel s3h14 TaxID=2009179 RepID=UPI00113FFD97|nr:hypothetical protein [Pseudomonas sp. Irchel s3h14]
MSAKSVTYNFTSRKRAFGNHWLIYSNKAKCILSLLSDREVAHWVLNLEFCSNIKSFEFGDYETEIEINGEKIFSKYRLRVETSSGVEYHKISVNKSEQNKRDADFLDNCLWREKHIRFRHVTDEELNCERQKIFPLLKLSAFLTASREQYIPPNLIDSANLYITRFGKGTLLHCLAALNEYSKATVMLQIYRLYNAGKILIAFEETPFSLDSQWRLNNE